MVDYAAGAWTVSDPTLLRAFGVIWALLGIAFIAAACVTWMRRPAWPRVLAIISLASLVVVSVALWSSVAGVVIDVALIGLAARAGAASRAAPPYGRESIRRMSSPPRTATRLHAAVYRLTRGGVGGRMAGQPVQHLREAP